MLLQIFNWPARGQFVKRTTATSTTRSGGGFHRELRLMLLLISLLLVTLSFAEALKRTQYHEQGTHGPKSYKFGFSVNDHKNPQERHEVSDKKGHVKGWYSYKDPHGKMMVFHYEAHPKKGFKVKKYKHKKHHHHG